MSGQKLSRAEIMVNLRKRKQETPNAIRVKRTAAQLDLMIAAPEAEQAEWDAKTKECVRKRRKRLEKMKKEQSAAPVVAPASTPTTPAPAAPAAAAAAAATPINEATFRDCP